VAVAAAAFPLVVGILKLFGNGRLDPVEG
jgi:hypothetical protein